MIERMITLELTDEEALSLRNLLDVAVRASGMRGAEFALLIDKKIVDAAQTTIQGNSGVRTRDDRSAQ